MKRILVLSTARTPANTAINKTFISSVQAGLTNAEIVWRPLRDVSFYMGEDGFEAYLMPEKTPINSYDFVYFKSYYREREVAVTLIEYLDQNNISFICAELKNYISFSKLSQYARLMRAELPIPNSIYISRKYLFKSYGDIVERLGSPFILKATDAKGGDHNYLIKNEAEFKVNLAKSRQTRLVAQNFIANTGDMRLLVLMYKLKMAMLRQRKDSSTHLNNTSKGAEAKEVSLSDLPKEVHVIAEKAAKVMQREIAGVDVMLESGTNKAYVLEINASPQVASGALKDRKIALYTKLFQELIG